MLSNIKILYVLAKKPLTVLTMINVSSNLLSFRINVTSQIAVGESEVFKDRYNQLEETLNDLKMQLENAAQNEAKLAEKIRTEVEDEFNTILKGDREIAEAEFSKLNEKLALFLAEKTTLENERGELLVQNEKLQKDLLSSVEQRGLTEKDLKAALGQVTDLEKQLELEKIEKQKVNEVLNASEKKVKWNPNTVKKSFF